MKVLYFLALVVFCCAFPIGSPPQNVKVIVRHENGIYSFILSWDEDSCQEKLGAQISMLGGKLYFSESKKDDGSKILEVVAPSNPEKPISLIEEFEVSASENKFTHEMEKGVVYQAEVKCKTPDGYGPPSERVSFSVV